MATTALKETNHAAAQSALTARLNFDRLAWKISPYLYSQFIEHLGRCVYGGIWVGEDSSIENDHGIRKDVLSALQKIELPALRWPGGCYADNYNWRDGIGPRDKRPKRHNLWWSQPESNHFGTEEFMRLAKLLKTEPYIAVNVGSGTVENALAWVEYLTSNQNTDWANLRRANGAADPYKIQFWGVGNENWGCGGCMRPEYYADQYRQYATYIRRFVGEEGKLIASGSNGWDIYNPEWDERFLNTMKGAFHLLDYISVHIYSGLGISDTQFGDDNYYGLIASIEKKRKYLERCIGLFTSYSHYGRPIGLILDEWGTWFKEAVVENGLHQQSTMQDALFTAASLHAFHSLGEKFFMANMAQTVNVLQALIITEGPKMFVTPTYHVWEMFMPHRGAQYIPVELEGAPELPGKDQPAVTVNASQTEDGSVFATLVNLHLEKAATITLQPSAGRELKVDAARRLGTGKIRDMNTFDEPEKVKPVAISATGLTFTLPPQSITAVSLS